MNSDSSRPPSIRLSRFAVATLVFFALVFGSLHGSELPDYTGYTRPGSPDDILKDGKIRFAVKDPALSSQTVGGTVYFTVLQLSDSKDDPWGSNVRRFVSAFRPGIDFSGASSPELNTSAKYLYLYQVVNDRKSLTPIQSVSVKLLVDARDITSWGYFSGVGFATSEVSSTKKQITNRLRPVSYSNVVADGPDKKMYRDKAPAIQATDLLRLTRVPTRRGEQAPKEEENGKRIVQVHWDALDPANNPTYVMMLSDSDFKGYPSFRAIWTGDDMIHKDGRSTVFGFTSNLPPTIEPTRLRGQLVEVIDGKIRPVVENDKTGDPLKMPQADGNVPTPLPDHPLVAPLPDAAPPADVAPELSSLPQNCCNNGSPGGGSPGGGSPGGGGFGIPTAIGSSSGGGGSGGGGSGGGNVPPAEVIPEPAALLLAGIGLPFLLMLRWWQTRRA